MVEKNMRNTEFNLPHRTDIITTVLPAESNWIPKKVDSEKINSPYRVRFDGEEAALSFCVDVLAETLGISNPENLSDVTFTNKYAPIVFIAKEITKKDLLREGNKAEKVSVS